MIITSNFRRNALISLNWFIHNNQDNQDGLKIYLKAWRSLIKA